MPILVLATRLCPESVEATLFATLMSVFNCGNVVAGFLGGSLMSSLGVTSDNFDNLPLLIVLCSASSLLPLPFLSLIDAARDNATDGDASEGESEGGAARGRPGKDAED